MSWWQSALKIGGAAAHGYANPGMGGVGHVVGSLLNNKKKKKPGEVIGPEDEELAPADKYPSYWEDEKREDW